MKYLMIFVFLFSSLALAAEKPVLVDNQWTPRYTAFYNACKSLYAWQTTQPTCNLIIAKSKHQLVDVSEYNAWCGMANKAKHDAQAYAAEYKKLANKQVQVEECPADARE